MAKKCDAHGSLRGTFTPPVALSTLSSHAHHSHAFDTACRWLVIFQEEFPVRDFPAGYGPASTAPVGAKPPTITTLRYTGPAAEEAPSSSGRASQGDNSVYVGGEGDADLLLCGCDDGAVTVRPALAAGVYARVQAHDGDAAVAAAACSCDGQWIVSGDSDGLLAVHRLRRKPFEVLGGKKGKGDVYVVLLAVFLGDTVGFHQVAPSYVGLSSSGARRYERLFELLHETESIKLF